MAGVGNSSCFSDPVKLRMKALRSTSLCNTTDTVRSRAPGILRGGATGLDGSSFALAGEYYSRANLFSRDREIAVLAEHFAGRTTPRAVRPSRAGRTSGPTTRQQATTHSSRLERTRSKTPTSCGILATTILPAPERRPREMLLTACSTRRRVLPVVELILTGSTSAPTRPPSRPWRNTAISSAPATRSLAKVCSFTGTSSTARRNRTTAWRLRRLL